MERGHLRWQTIVSRTAEVSTERWMRTVRERKAAAEGDD